LSKKDFSKGKKNIFVEQLGEVRNVFELQNPLKNIIKFNLIKFN